MKQYFLLKLSAIAEYMTEQRLQNACMLALFVVILCADSIVNAICKLMGV